MKVNTSNFLKLLIVGGALLIHSGVVAAKGAVGSNGNPTGVYCEWTGGAGTPTISTGSTGAGALGNVCGGLHIGAVTVGGFGTSLGSGSATTGHGGNGGQAQLGSNGPGGQVGYPGNGGTFTYLNG